VSPPKAVTLKRHDPNLRRRRLVTPQDRLGIVGANGTGKTTLLRILAEIEHLDKGRIQRQKQLRIGYLPQDGLSLSGRTVFDECLSVFDEALSLEREQEELTGKMSELDHQSEEYQAVIDRYEWVIDRYHALDGYTKEAQVGTVLAGLGFPKEDWARKTEEFSGGWQMRIALSKLLLEKPNLLLLDEPTNHLDLEARNWLEDYLNSYPFAFILISHDRYFLDTTQDHRDLEQAGALLRRKLREVPGLEAAKARAARSDSQKPAGPHSPPGDLHQPFPLQGVESLPGAEPPERARKDRSH
jgi:ATPase subunit of ABC transporter with duplicated ATPase domains